MMLDANPQWVDLRLSDCSLGQSTSTAFNIARAVQRHKNLKCLNLSNNNIQDNGALLAVLFDSSSLQKLVLSQNGFGRHGHPDDENDDVAAVAAQQQQHSTFTKRSRVIKHSQSFGLTVTLTSPSCFFKTLYWRHFAITIRHCKKLYYCCARETTYVTALRPSNSSI